MSRGNEKPAVWLDMLVACRAYLLMLKLRLKPGPRLIPAVYFEREIAKTRGPPTNKSEKKPQTFWNENEPHKEAESCYKLSRALPLLERRKG